MKSTSKQILMTLIAAPLVFFIAKFIFIKGARVTAFSHSETTATLQRQQERKRLHEMFNQALALWHASGDHEGAEGKLKEYVNETGDHSALLTLADWQTTMGKKDEALKNLERVLFPPSTEWSTLTETPSVMLMYLDLCKDLKAPPRLSEIESKLVSKKLPASRGPDFPPVTQADVDRYGMEFVLAMLAGMEFASYGESKKAVSQYRRAYRLVQNDTVRFYLGAEERSAGDYLAAQATLKQVVNSRTASDKLRSVARIYLDQVEIQIGMADISRRRAAGEYFGERARNIDEGPPPPPRDKP